MTVQMEILGDHPRYNNYNLPLWFNMRASTSIPFINNKSTASGKVPKRLIRGLPKLESDVLALIHATGFNATGQNAP